MKIKVTYIPSTYKVVIWWFPNMINDYTVSVAEWADVTDETE